MQQIAAKKKFRASLIHLLNCVEFAISDVGLDGVVMFTVTCDVLSAVFYLRHLPLSPHTSDIRIVMWFFF